MEWTSLIAGVTGFAALIGAIVALYKVRPEAGQIAVTAAQGAVIVQTGVIDSLREELRRLESEVSDLQERTSAALRERNRLYRENEDLREEVARLEKRVQELEGRDQPEPHGTTAV